MRWKCATASNGIFTKSCLGIIASGDSPRGCSYGWRRSSNPPTMRTRPRGRGADCFITGGKAGEDDMALFFTYVLPLILPTAIYVLWRLIVSRHPAGAG